MRISLRTKGSLHLPLIVPKHESVGWCFASQLFNNRFALRAGFVMRNEVGGQNHLGMSRTRFRLGTGLHIQEGYPCGRIQRPVTWGILSNTVVRRDSIPIEAGYLPSDEYIAGTESLTNPAELLIVIMEWPIP